MTPIRTILHATDFSELANTAFEFASALARDYLAKLVVLHVKPPVRVFAPDGITVPFPVEDDRAIQARLMALKPANAPFPFEHQIVEGDAATEILKAAEDCNADLIVMGTHGHSGLVRMLTGSVAESVLRKAPCPVLTVRGARKLTDACTTESSELATAH